VVGWFRNGKRRSADAGRNDGKQMGWRKMRKMK
jgi:hypothetical protein